MNQPHNQYLIPKIRAALKVNMRPSAFILRLAESPGSAWDLFDYGLAEAFHTIDDEKCPMCGNPVWLCRNTDSNLEFGVKQGVCYATRRLEQHKVDKLPSKERKDASKNKKEWGAYYYTVPKTVLPDTKLPTRSDWYNGMVEKS